MSFKVERMTFDVFDAQASLLYVEAPDVDFEQFVEQAADWCAAGGLSESYTALPDVSSGASRCFVGNGFHIWITVTDQPIDAVAFALPLRSPLLKHKNFVGRTRKLSEGRRPSNARPAFFWQLLVLWQSL